MTSAQVADQRIETYLGRLETALSRVPEDDRQDILLEIRAHILDSTAGTPSLDGTVERVLGLLGTPEELATGYATERMLARASRSLSPWLLLRSSWKWAKSGVRGMLAFLIALFGYAMALGLTVSIFLKPLMPSKVGLWVAPGKFNVGIPAHPEPMHELLGRYFVPVIAAAAFAFAIGTTHALRWMIQKRTPKYGLTQSGLPV